MNNLKKTIVVLALVLVLCPGILKAEKSESKFKFSFLERFRFVGWDYAIGLSEEHSAPFAFTRHKTSLGMVWTPDKNLQVGVKLTNEFRNYLTPDRDFEIDEIIVDQLYVKLKKIGKLPLSLTIGRQNIILGEGFLVLEGHPLDGSRSIYFNAVRADYSFSKNHKLTSFYSIQSETDTALALINDQERALMEWKARGLGFYYTGLFNKTKVESYFLRKETDASDKRPFDVGINAVGARVSLPLGGKFSLTAEGAYQFGDWGGEDMGAMGGYFHLDYKFKNHKFLKTATLGGIYLSGDDPATSKMEGWDPLFSRWPKWSESFIYVLITERGVAYWTNFTSLYVSLSVDIAKNMDFKVAYHRLGAVEENPLASNGKTRGGLLVSRLNFKLNKYFSGHFVWEHFKPGSFYPSGAASYNWLRFELAFKL
ncbi:MAG: alginate export family protein [bacterium]|nr:alginate export family protein [bacterium]